MILTILGSQGVHDEVSQIGCLELRTYLDCDGGMESVVRTSVIQVGELQSEAVVQDVEQVDQRSGMVLGFHSND